MWDTKAIKIAIFSASSINAVAIDDAEKMIGHGYSPSTTAIIREVMLDSWWLIGTYDVLFLRIWGVLFGWITIPLRI